MLSLSTLASYLHALLAVDSFKDYCPNGLQIEGRSTIKTLVTGVTANQALIDQAVQLNADALLVHHGFFWKNEAPCLVGIKYKRIKSLINNNISLFSYHLPLDVHAELGNNIQLANRLGIINIENYAIEPGLLLGCKGEFSTPINGDDLNALLSRVLTRTPLHIEAKHKPIKRVALCTGGAQDYLQQAIEQGVDAYITGEISERTVHTAIENNIHFYAAGHHATERYGVQALGKHLSERYHLVHHFIDIDNPV